MHVQFVLVMYTPGFRPFASEIDIQCLRATGGKPFIRCAVSRVPTRGPAME